MAYAKVDGLSISYEVIGTGRPWAITPGGRFSKDFPGVRELAEGLAEHGNQVLIYDRPNCGESDVCFTGASESAMQADTLAALLRHLDMAPAVISGGSGGARVSLLTAARAPRRRGRPRSLVDQRRGVRAHEPRHALLRAEPRPRRGRTAWKRSSRSRVGRGAPRNPSNRQRILDQDRREFIATMERWMLAYCPCGGELVPGLTTADAQAIDVPALVFRSGESDAYHTARRRNRLRRCCRTHDSWNPRGVTASGSSGRRTTG